MQDLQAPQQAKIVSLLEPLPWQETLTAAEIRVFGVYIQRKGCFPSTDSARLDKS
jgi:hypothetical protein